MTPTSPDADSRWAAQVSRRVVLRAATGSALALLVEGCGHPADRSEDPAAPRTTGTTTAPADLDLRLVTRAISDEEALQGFCTVAARRFAGERASLRAVAERQRIHVSRLRGALTDLRPPVREAPVRLPRTSAGLTSALRERLLQARSDRAANCAAATSGLLAELFASMAAGHAVTLLSVDPEAAAPGPFQAPRRVPSAPALQPCLAAEHAAVFGYGVVGGVLSAAVSDAPSARAAVAAYDEHRVRRDVLSQLIDAAGADPVAAKASYELPFTVAGIPTARRLARYLEDACATVYARATAMTTGDTRVMVSEAVADCALRGARWGAAPAALPGLDP